MGKTSRASGPSVRKIPPGDTAPRLVCPDCGFILYENPKVIVGSVCRWEGRILLCRRAIEPRKGLWTLPAGFLELNETVLDGARREAREEANAEIEIDALLAVYTIPRVGHVQLIYRARLASPDVRAGDESEEVALFAWDEIPWDDLAFPSVSWALRHDREVMEQAAAPGAGAVFAPHTNPPGDLGDFGGL